MTTTCAIETLSLSLFDFGATIPGARTCWISALTGADGQPEFHVHGTARPNSWTVANVWNVRIVADIQLTNDIATWEVRRGGHAIVETRVAPFLWDNTCKSTEMMIPWGMEFANPFFHDRRTFSVYKVYGPSGYSIGWSACPGILNSGATVYPTRREACIEFLKRSEIIVTETSAQ